MGLVSRVRGRERKGSWEGGVGWSKGLEGERGGKEYAYHHSDIQLKF